MALYAVELDQASKRIAVPTLDHDLILSNTAAAIGNRAGVASLQVIKNFIGGGGVTVSASAPSSPAAGNLWWDTSGNPDAGLKIRIGSSWVLVVTGIPTLPSVVTQAQAEAGTVTGTRLWSPLRIAQAIAALAPSGVTGASNADIIDARIVSWALANSPSGHAPIGRGGTGSNTASGARTSLGLGTAAQLDTGTAQGDVVVVGVNDMIVSSLLAAGATDNTDCLRGNRTWGPINHPIVTQAEAEAGTALRDIAPGRRNGSPRRLLLLPQPQVAASRSAPRLRQALSNGDLWWDTSGTVDAGLKVRVSGSWVSVVDPARLTLGAPSFAVWLRANLSRRHELWNGARGSRTARARDGRRHETSASWQAETVIVLGSTDGLIARGTDGNRHSFYLSVPARRQDVGPTPGHSRPRRLKPRPARVGSIRSWTPVRVKQAIAALAGDGTGFRTTGADWRLRDGLHQSKPHTETRTVRCPCRNSRLSS